MPELPEVETIVRACRPRLRGRRILAFTSLWPRNVAPSAAQVRRLLAGQTITRLTRRAKFIVAHLGNGGCLLIHLGMSGRLEWAAESVRSFTSPAEGRRYRAERQRPSHVRATWKLDDGSRLAFCDPRKFGRILYVRDLRAATAKLGPEPLARGFTVATLDRLLRGRRRQLKPLLLDQSAIAGLGNIYTDEALFRAGLHPTLRSDRVTRGGIVRLHRAIRQVLRLAIRHHGTSFDWAYPGGWMQDRLMVYGRAGQPCRRCRTAIVSLRIGQRGTHICPRCQPGPRPGRTRPRRTRT